MENNPIDFQEMATEQENCAETQKLISGPTALTISLEMGGGHRHTFGVPNQYLSIDDTVTMNEFLVQINNILNNYSLPRHNVAADRELPEDLPPDLWAAHRVWVHRCGHLSLLYDGPYAVIQRRLRFFKLQIGGKEDKVSTSHLEPCSTSTPTMTPPTPSAAHHRRPASADGSVSTSPPYQRLQTLEPFFLSSQTGFLNAQRRGPRAATPPTTWATPRSLSLRPRSWRDLCGEPPSSSTYINKINWLYQCTYFCTQ
jgi:hypothetical protein